MERDENTSSFMPAMQFTGRARRERPRVEAALGLRSEGQYRESQIRLDNLGEEFMTQQQSKPKERVRYAVVGLGYIAQAAVLPAFAHARENSELVALVSGDATKLKKLSRKYQVLKGYTYEKYADCLESGEVDAVYIALPNNMHRAYTEGAARAGVHVLCEKPMAVDVAECEAMIEATERGNVKLMIAYRLHFEKGNLAAVETIKNGKIGDPRIFRSAFCQQVVAGNSRLEGELAAGPLYDVGVYCINAARYLFGAEPYEVFGYGGSGKDQRFAEIDEMSAALLRFPDDRLATFTCSFGAADRSSYEVIGTKGVLKMDPAYEMVGDLKCELTIDGRTRKMKYPKRDQFGPELMYFSNCILNNTEPEPNGREGMADIRIINALLESEKKGRPSAISGAESGQRPGQHQEIHKPPVDKPYLVKATAPTK
jgi:glucose-fructose oxidoreductase